MKDRIMVIGGYGEVGRQVAIKLCSDGMNVIIAGHKVISIKNIND